MPLPQISTPTYELTIPSSKKKIKYRPFLVREEKILILALESENEKQIADAIKTTLKSCIQTRGVKVEDLPTFDIEYIFLNIRGKSVGESVDLVVTCPDDLETTVDTKIYIDEIQVNIDEKHNRDIKLDGNLTLTNSSISMRGKGGEHSDYSAAANFKVTSSVFFNTTDPVRP